VESRSRGGNRSVYTVFGKSYRVLDDARGYRERGPASWYGKKFHGRSTANGERYDMYQMTAAHKHLPLPSYVRVRNLENGREIIVRVNDRGPFHGNRIIDLSYAAATKLGMLRNGTAEVEIEVIDAAAWQQARKRETSAQPEPLLQKQKPQQTQLAKQVAVDPTRQQQSSGEVAGTNMPALPVAALAGSGRHYLQVAAFSELEKAQGVQNSLLQRLNRGEIPALAHNVVIHPVDNADLYRVRIGPLPSRDHVQQLLEHPSLSQYTPMHGVSEQ
ncbi:MAG: septal ring lytic transglycosylase RlpA family protein, partial [Pseudomonadales bacterium]